MLIFIYVEVCTVYIINYVEKYWLYKDVCVYPLYSVSLHILLFSLGDYLAELVFILFSPLFRVSYLWKLRRVMCAV